MAIRLPDSLEITWDDEQEPVHSATTREPRTPTTMDGWAAHLSEWHGYRIVRDPVKKRGTCVTIELALVCWSPRAKFQPNQRVTVNDKAPGDYASRRGTVVGWRARTSEYVVAFEEDPLRGALSSSWLEPFVKA